MRGEKEVSVLFEEADGASWIKKVKTKVSASSWMCSTGIRQPGKMSIIGKQREMLKLVRFQKKEMLVACGCEELVCSRQMLASEGKNRDNLGALADIPMYRIPYTRIKKMVALKNHIWGLQKSQNLI